MSQKAIARGWDGFARLSASIKDGWYPAPDALEQYGSVSQGDPICTTGIALGKLLRSIYLCDYFGNTEFRDGVLDLLNQGEVGSQPATSHSTRNHRRQARPVGRAMRPSSL